MNTTNTKTWTITIRKEDVYFDMDMMSMMYSDVTAGDSPIKGDRIATETASDASKRIIRRLCDHRVSDIRQLLEKFIDSTTATTANNALSTSDWTLNLRITTEAEDNTLATITDLCHDYIVTGALADFYAQIGVAGNRESLNIRANEDLARIKKLIFHRPMP